jgi:nicotinate-nucleotide pyrophosphorylase (carboxylating)
VDQVNASGCGAGIFDTRKTMPGYRFFDKYAVRCGGGHNHRMSLSDQVLLKENHIAKFGGVRGVLDAVRQELGPEIPVIIEVRSLAELLEAQEGPCDIIMLDNFSVGMIMEAIDRKNTGIQFEISGGITPANLHQFLIPGVDRLSVGSITHSVQAPDLTLLVTEEA